MTDHKPEKLNFVSNITTSYCVAKGDTGATGHYWTEKDKGILKNIKQTNGPSVQLPDSSMIPSTEQGNLPLSPHFSASATKTCVLPNLKSANLISLGQLCDDGCTIILNQDTMNVIKNNTTVLKGIRNRKDGLWDIPIPKSTITTNCCVKPQLHGGLYPSQQTEPRNKQVHHTSTTTNVPQHLQALSCLAADNDFNNALDQQQRYDKRANKHHLNIILRKKETQMNLVRYLHGACFSPVPSTFKKAIKRGFLSSWPGLTTQMVDKYLPPSEATAKGHIRQEAQHLQSTKGKPRSNTHPIDQLCEKTASLSLNSSNNTEYTVDTHDIVVPPDTQGKTNDVVYIIINHDDMVTGYMDLTGRFPQRSSRGNNYILVGYHYDANAITANAIKDRTATSITHTWQTLHESFEQSNSVPNIYVLDNEKSKMLTDAFLDKGVKYQLVPPNNHRTNLAERAIQTFKSHFKAGLATCDPNYPLSEWDRLIEQAVLTLNLLRPSRFNPNISAHHFLYGHFDFNSTPLAPPGIKVIAHLKPEQRASWELQGENGYYIGPSLEHYRCIKCYFPKHRSERVCDTVEFIPHIIPVPETKLEDFLRQAAGDIVNILKHPPSTVYPSLKAGDPVRNAVLELSEQLGRITSIEHVQSKILDKSTPTPAPPRVGSRVSSPPRVGAQSSSPPRVRTRKRIQSSIEHEPQISIDALEGTSRLPMNNRFNNKIRHRYPLRSLSHTTSLEESLECDIRAAMHIFTPEGQKMSMDSLLSSSDGPIWERSLSNEWGRLASGNRYGAKGTKTIAFISRSEVPHGHDVTYATFVCDIKPLKVEKFRVRVTVGGDRLTCLQDTGSPAANMLETKLLLNSTISDAKYGARFFSCDIVNYFLASPMNKSEYMKVKIKYLPQDIIDHYNLQNLVTEDGYVFIRIDKGMYGLKNAAILAYDNLKKHLAPYGYFPVKGTVGLWRHTTKRTRFCLCVDDFGVKTFTKEDSLHLLDALRSHYRITIDWSGTNYCGLTLDWSYNGGFVDISMSGYITKALERLNHKPKVYPQTSPHEHTPIKYMRKGEQQFAKPPDPTAYLPPPERRHLQSIVGTLLYYGRSLDYSILPALNDISRDQSKPTHDTMTRAKRVLDYCATYPNVYIRYHASPMVLSIDSDAAYLVAPEARSRIAGYFYLSKGRTQSMTPPLNGAVLVECKTLRHVVASAAEAEVAGIFHNAQIAVLVRRMLRALDHPQPPTPIKTDNSTANGFIHNNIHQKRSKSWDMRYYWLREKNLHKELQFFWEKGKTNDADYFTKHHPAKYHRMIRPKYIQDKIPSLKI